MCALNKTSEIVSTVNNQLTIQLTSAEKSSVVVTTYVHVGGKALYTEVERLRVTNDTTVQ